MKKISIITLMCALAVPAMAKDVASVKDESIAEQYAQQFKETSVQNYSSPATKFPHGLQMGLGVSSTSGMNIFVGYNNKNFDSFWAKRFGIRFDFATYSPIKSSMNNGINNAINKDGFEIDKHLKINNFDMDAKHFGAMIDFYPFGNTWFLGGWRVSGGYFTGDLDLRADVFAKNDGGKFDFEIGSEKYYYDGVMKGKATVNWKYNGPYLGTGFDFGLIAGLKIFFDAGVVFAGKSADLNLDVPLDGLKHQGTGADVIASELNAAKAKAIKEAKDELNKYPYYPLVKIGLMYRF